MCVYDFKSVFFERFYCFIVPVIAQNHTLLQSQEITGIGPLFTCVEGEFIIPGINKFHFTSALHIHFADLNQQVFEVIKIDRVLNIFFSELNDI